MTATNQDRIIMLFENKERTYDGPIAYAESDYDYLDRSARQESTNVRDFLNKCVSQFPQNEASELISRIKSRGNSGFDSATFEIILFAIVSGLGGLLKVHPEMNNGSTKRPDFMVRMPNGEEFYLEAVIASELRAPEKAAEQRKKVVLDSIEKLESPDFIIGVKAEGNPDTPPPAKKLRHYLSNWLSDLDPDIVAKEVEEYGNDCIPTTNWNHDGWDLVFDAKPIKPERRGKGQRVIGSLASGGRFVNTWEPIREAVLTKGGRYGELTKPFIVAVNVDALSLDPIDEMQSLFGQLQYVINHRDPLNELECRRTGNGAWNGPNGPRYTRVSGVWIFDRFTPWNMLSRRNTLYFNPWAQFPVPSELCNVNHAIVKNEEMEWIESSNLSDILQLPQKWPE